ncbi:response regulator [Oscillibacter hominis]|uniref:Stage 0 sporulation protein A homolog n=1 Tax=Oscillibacter hominis TaxID=2763056 RepID=A0A7G9B4X1_9FIRM|nr:response regulator [Oscillibacter hominis]QNL44602.1 response regulator [Oscillibacter hominis]
MKAIMVDDQPLMVRFFEAACANLPGVESMEVFTSPLEALEYARRNFVELAFLDLSMPQMSGLELGEKLKILNPHVILIYLTAYDDCAIEALHQRAGYILCKPYNRQDVLEILEKALGQSEYPGSLGKKVMFRTFGRFDMYIDGQLVVFRSAKAKELLALCVSREGGEVSSSEAIDKIWAGSKNRSSTAANYRMTVKKLREFLQELGVERIFVRERQSCYIRASEVSCDLYDFWRGDEEALYRFRDEFMSEYSWSEPMIFQMQEFKQIKLMVLHQKE